MWGFGDGSADNVGTTNTSVSRTYANPGTYNVRFQVRDNLRAQITATTQIYVGVTPPAGGMPPVPIVRADRLAGLAPMTVNFDGESSFDIDGTIVSYEWNFGEYSSPLNYSKESKPRYRYTQPGTYYGSLTTKDNGGRTAVRYFAAYVLPSVLPTELDILAFPQKNRSKSIKLVLLM